MKVLINRCYDGFGLTLEAQEKLGHNMWFYNEYEHRTAPELIELFEKEGNSIEDWFAHLVLFDLPDNVTDWMIFEYDGLETLFCVVDGKIYDAYDLKGVIKQWNYQDIIVDIVNSSKNGIKSGMIIHFSFVSIVIVKA